MRSAYGESLCKECSCNVGKEVVGSGCPDHPSLMLIDGAPGKRVSARGKAFSGDGGKLVREIMSAIGMDTSDVWYTYACPCPTMNGKDPKSSDLRACHGGLLKEIERVHPGMVIAMGNAALTSLIGSGLGITKRRGFCHTIYFESFEVTVFPTLSPVSVAAAPDGFRDLLDDFQRIQKILNGEPASIDPPYRDFRPVSDERGLVKLTNELKRLKVPAALDIETTALEPGLGDIISMGFTWATEDGYETRVLDMPRAYYSADVSNLVRARFKRAMRGLDVICHNAQFDVYWLWERGFDVNIVADTMLESYCLDERQGSHGLKALSATILSAPEYDAGLDKKLDPVKWFDNPEYAHEVLMYNGADAYYTMRLHEHFVIEMADDNVSLVNDLILIPATRHFIRLRMEGMRVDTQYLEDLGRRWESEIAEIESHLRSFEGAEDMNLRSTKQISEYLYDTLGLKTIPAKPDGTLEPLDIAKATAGIDDDEAQEYWRTTNVKRGTKAKATSTYMLWWLAQQHEFPRWLVKHRLLSKAHGAYYSGYKAIMDSEGRIRPRFKLHGTRTGRLSSSDPNIHGMPRNKDIKRIFEADPGMTIISADYSQAEVRMVAHLARDEHLLAAIKSTDIHRAISMRLFSLTDEELDAMSEQERTIKRRAAKTIVFGLIYGRSAGSLAPQMGVTEKEAEEYMAMFYKMMPQVREWIAVQHAQVMIDREVISLFGRKRRFPVVIGRKHASEIRRQAVNFPVQSSVSDMTLLANMRIIQRLDEAGIECRVWPHVHDGFYFQVNSDYVDKAIEITKEEMHDVPFETDVPFAAEIAIGSNWGKLEVVYEG